MPSLPHTFQEIQINRPQIGSEERAAGRSWKDRPVAFLATTNSLGGLERLSLRLAAKLRERGADVKFFNAPESPLSLQCRDLNFPQKQLTVKNSGDLSAAVKLAKYLVRDNIGILHVHSRRDFVPAVIAVKLSQCQLESRPKLVLHVHQVRRLGTGGAFSDIFFNWGADKVIAVSNAVKDKICCGSNLKANLVDVLLNGVSEADFVSVNSQLGMKMRQKMKKHWQVDIDVPVIGMVGKLDQKGQEFVAEAIPEILKHVPNAHFVFVGPGGDSDTIRDITRRAKANGTYDRIVFAGVIKDLSEVYAAMDLFVHLPTDEAFGLAVAEAMASSLPVIAGNVGGCTELVEHMRTGVLVEPRNKQQLVEAVSLILSDNIGARRLRAELGNAARERIENSFTLDRQVDNLSAIYTDIYSLGN